MYARQSILALAAVAAIGTTALSSTSAFAFHPIFPVPIGFHPHFPPPIVHPHFPPPIFIPHHVGWHAPIIVGGPVVSQVGYAPAIQATPRLAEPSRCSCLTKEYTSDGNVLFKDLCTKESALAPTQEALALQQQQEQQSQPQVQPQPPLPQSH